MDSVQIAVCLSKMNKVTTVSGFVVTGVMGGIASLATSLLPKTLFRMNTFAQSACKMFIWAEIL